MIPTFFQEDKFKINIDLLKNDTTITHISSDPKLEYIFKIILGSFNKKKKKPIGIFNEKTVELFNNEVDKISIYLDDILEINREFMLRNNDLMNFKDYFKIKYNTDAAGDVYPDVDKLSDKIEQETGKEKKKKATEVPKTSPTPQK